MTTELHYLALVTALTGLLWVPYIVDRMTSRGLADAIGYAAPSAPQSAWAERLRRAHANAIENLVVFAALVLVANAAGISNPVVATAAIVYFWARVVHALAYTLAIPVVRTLAFFASFVAQAMVAWQLIAAH